MSKPDPTSEATSTNPSALAASIRRRPVRALQAIADPVRYRALKELAEGAALSVKDLAARLDCHPDTMGKHMKVLRTRGLVVSAEPFGADGRKQLNHIPAEFRTTDPVSGKPVLDFGVCLVRFD